MAVGAPHAKGANPCDQAFSGPGPVLQPGLHPQPELIERDARVWRFEVQTCRELSVVDTKRGFDQTGDSGCRLEMSDIRLDGTYVYWLSIPIHSEYRAQRRRFYRVTDTRTRAMKLDVLHIAGSDA